MSKRKLREVNDFLAKLAPKADTFEIAIREEGLYVLDTDGEFGHGWYACHTEHMEEINDPWNVPRSCLHPKAGMQPIPNTPYTQCKKCGCVLGGTDPINVSGFKAFLSEFSEDSWVHFLSSKLSIQESTKKGIKFTHFDEYAGEIKTTNKSFRERVRAQFRGSASNINGDKK